MQYRKFGALFSLILLFCGCASSAQIKLSHPRPVGFWENKEAVVQVLHFYSKLETDKTGKPILDDKGRFTTSVAISLGTGSVVDTNGLVLTNNHIVNENCPITVTPDIIFPPLPESCPLKTVITADQLATPLPKEIYLVCKTTDKRDCHSAKLIAEDTNNDLGLLQTDTTFPRAIKFVDDSELVPGDEVYFWGNVGMFLPPSPFFGRYVGRVGPPYFKGDIFGKYEGDLLPLLLMDIYLVSGSSGSPIFDRLGRAIGVNNSILPSVMMGMSGARSLGITIPSHKAIEFIKKNSPKLPKK